MFFKIVFFVLLFQYSFAVISDEEVKIEFTKKVMKCTKENHVEMSELLGLQALKVPTNKEAKCLLACAYRATTALNDKGLYDYKANMELVRITAGDDKDRLARAKKLVEACMKVNDQKVSDGAKGCDRAALIFSCITKTAPKLGFKV